MLTVDFHSHSHFSCCGLHSIMELLTRARDLGLEALAITDHGPALNGRVSSVYFERLRDPLPGTQLLKGMECNLVDAHGGIDLPREYLQYMDLVLLGFHHIVPGSSRSVENTDTMLRALDRNPAVDIITHPNDPSFPLEFIRLAREAKAREVVLEFNNSKTALARVSDAITLELMEACAQERCQVACNSDAHAIGEIGQDEAIRALMARCGFPEELVINTSWERARVYLEKRRANRRELMSADL